MEPLISIIIPCYNSGAYLPDAIESVECYPDKSVYELIIINDGSTAIDTIQLLNSLEQKGYNIIHQENGGPAAARNAGVKASKGKYLLFLDSDNKIRNAYIDTGIKVLNAQPDVGVVYGNAAFFGSTTEPRFYPKPFDLYQLLVKNYIDICSVMRREVWESTGGFDESRVIIGHEDWEFWLRVGTLGWKCLFINEILFDYRVNNDSLVMQVTSSNSKTEKYQEYIYQKHGYLLAQKYKSLLGVYSAYEDAKRRPFVAFGKLMYRKYFFKPDGSPKMKTLYNFFKKKLKK
jgi:glycosyltransferase involved in cell wall biosynthesis